LGPNLENMHNYRVFVRLNRPSKENIAKLTLFLLNLKQIRRVVSVFGNFDVYYDILVPNGEEHRRVKRQVEQRFYQIINTQTSVRIFEELRFCYYPPVQRLQKHTSF